MNKELTFNDLPMVVAQLRDEVVGMKQMIKSAITEQATQGEHAHTYECRGSIGIPENADGNSLHETWKRQHSCHQAGQTLLPLSG